MYESVSGVPRYSINLWHAFYFPGFWDRSTCKHATNHCPLRHVPLNEWHRNRYTNCTNPYNVLMGNSSDPEAHGMTFCRVAQSRTVGLPWPWLKCLHDLSICLGSGVPCPSNSHIFGYDLKDYKGEFPYSVLYWTWYTWSAKDVPRMLRLSTLVILATASRCADSECEAWNRGAGEEVIGNRMSSHLWPHPRKKKFENFDANLSRGKPDGNTIGHLLNGRHWTTLDNIARS